MFSGTSKLFFHGGDIIWFELHITIVKFIVFLSCYWHETGLQHTNIIVIKQLSICGCGFCLVLETIVIGQYKNTLK